MDSIAVPKVSRKIWFIRAPPHKFVVSMFSQVHQWYSDNLQQNPDFDHRNSAFFIQKLMVIFTCHQVPESCAHGISFWVIRSHCLGRFLRLPWRILEQAKLVCVFGICLGFQRLVLDSRHPGGSSRVLEHFVVILMDQIAPF